MPETKILKKEKMKLRDYQIEATDALWSDLFSESTALCVLPTGTGKGEIIIELIRRSMNKRDIKIIVLVNKVKLLEQTVRRLSMALGEQSVGAYCGSLAQYDTDRSVTVASIQSIHDVDLNKIHLIILDEVHNVNQKEGRYISFLEKYKAKNEKLKIVAFTATPYRSTGKIYGESKLFKKISYHRSMPWMIDNKFIVRPTIKKVENQYDVSGLKVRAGDFVAEEVDKLVSNEITVLAQINDALPRLAGRKKIVWACANINHCNKVNDLLFVKDEKSVKLHSQMSEDDRDNAQKEFEEGDARHLVFVSIVSEGYDYAPIDAVVLMRPIRSPVLYVQTVGRGLRLSKDKENLLVLDYGSVVQTLGPVDNPLIGGGSRSKPEKTKVCKQCSSIIRISSKECPDCGFIFVSEQRDYTKNLTEKPFDLDDILSLGKKKIFTKGVKNVFLSKYKSKAGNDCLLITYETDDFLNLHFKEYFSWSTDYAKRRAQRRLLELDVDLVEPLEEQVKQKPKKIPRSISYFKDGKYEKIDRVNFL